VLSGRVNNFEIRERVRVRVNEINDFISHIQQIFKDYLVGKNDLKEYIDSKQEGKLEFIPI